MMEFVQSVLALLVTLSILVTFHEFGHYWVARLCNVHLIRFSVGFGRPLLTWRSKAPVLVESPSKQKISTKSNQPLAATEFVIAAIPLGGYVKMLDERESYVPDDQLHLAFNRKPLWQRIAIVAAGPMANFILAIVAYWALFMAGITGLSPILAELDPQSPAARAGLQQGQQIVAVDGRRTASWGEVSLGLFSQLGNSGGIKLTAIVPGYSSETEHIIPVTDWLASQDQPDPAGALGLKVRRPDLPARVGHVEASSVAATAGFLSGDKILSIDGQPIRYWSEMVAAIQAKPERMVSFSIARDGRGMVIDAMPAGRLVDGKRLGRLGVGVEYPPGWQDEFLVTLRYPFHTAWIHAIKETWTLSVFTVKSIGKLITGKISPKHIAGPITIAKVASDTAKSGVESFVRFIALISISLGVLNLLPIPVLDGGHLLYYLLEGVFRRPIPDKAQAWGLQLGLFLIGSLTLLALYNDLMRL